MVDLCYLQTLQNAVIDRLPDEHRDEYLVKLSEILQQVPRLSNQDGSALDTIQYDSKDLTKDLQMMPELDLRNPRAIIEVY
jgi:hypothetical protein